MAPDCGLQVPHCGVQQPPSPSPSGALSVGPWRSDTAPSRTFDELGLLGLDLVQPIEGSLRKSALGLHHALQLAHQGHRHRQPGLRSSGPRGQEGEEGGVGSSGIGVERGMGGPVRGPIEEKFPPPGKLRRRGGHRFRGTGDGGGEGVRVALMKYLVAQVWSRVPQGPALGVGPEVGERVEGDAATFPLAGVVVVRLAGGGLGPSSGSGRDGWRCSWQPVLRAVRVGVDAPRVAVGDEVPGGGDQVGRRTALRSRVAVEVGLAGRSRRCASAPGRWRPSWRSPGRRPARCS